MTGPADPAVAGDRPHLFMTRTSRPGLRSLEEIRSGLDAGVAGHLWSVIQGRAEADLDAEPILPDTRLSGRPESNAERGIRDYDVVAAAGQRVLRGALAAIITREARFRRASLTQLAALIDEDRWPEWRDQAHDDYPADLRTGQLARMVGLAYDWLHPSLSESERTMIVDGLDRRAIRPFIESVDAGAWWVDTPNNWQTTVVGGLGIAGMALAGDHPQSGDLIDLAVDRLDGYCKRYGPAGEFNESVGYASATRRPVTFYAALRYAMAGEHNRLGDAPFPQACRWLLYATLPPGRLAAFGDAKPDRTPRVGFLAHVAAATGDPVLQWYYRSLLGDRLEQVSPVELLGYDPTLEARPPRDLPLGRAYEGYGRLAVSRTSWDLATTDSVVYAKSGIEDNHEHHDAGQICLDGFGCRLLRDLGSPSGYPADYFDGNRYEYYNAASRGHNVLQVDEREMMAAPGDAAPVSATFRDDIGGVWSADLTDFHPVEAYRRTVVHLHPRTLVVLDAGRFAAPTDVSVRWHPASIVGGPTDGRFESEAGAVGLVGLLTAADGLTVSRGRHAYRPPHDRDRTGAALEDRREPYIDGTVHADRFRVLSAFAVVAPGEARVAFDRGTSGDGQTVRRSTPRGALEVRLDADTLTVANRTAGRGWRVPLAGAPAGVELGGEPDGEASSDG